METSTSKPRIVSVFSLTKHNGFTDVFALDDQGNTYIMRQCDGIRRWELVIPADTLGA